MTSPIFHELEKLAKAPGVISVTKIPVLDREQRILVPKEYVCLRCTDENGKEFRIAFAAVELKWICPEPGRMIQDRISGDSFFTEAEVGIRQGNEALYLEPRESEKPLIKYRSSKIEYRVGDASIVIGVGPWILAHVCNDRGAFGKGFSKAVTARFPAAAVAYRDMEQRILGEVQFVEIDERVTVANMIAQHGLRGLLNKVPLDYSALENCLTALAQKALDTSAKVQMPKIGSGLAGGDWSLIEKIVTRCLCNRGVEVYVYSLRRS